MEGLKQFTAPLDPTEIEWKIQGSTKSKDKTIVVPYINNRAVMNRLDSCFGAENWKSEFKPHNYQITKTGWGDKPDTQKDCLGMLCTLSIKISDVWISKSDGADHTNIEAFKGGISDSMKRVATQWGMGRDLYDYPKVFLEGQHYFIPYKAMDILEKLTAKKNSEGVNKSVITITKQMLT